MKYIEVANIYLIILLYELNQKLIVITFSSFYNIVIISYYLHFINTFLHNEKHNQINDCVFHITRKDTRCKVISLVNYTKTSRYITAAIEKCI